MRKLFSIFISFNQIFSLMELLKSLLLILLLAGASANGFAQKKTDPVGTWTFYAADAPYEYRSGDMMIGKDGEDYTAKIVFGDNYGISGRDVVLEKDQLSFKVSVEGETVYIKGTVSKETIHGTASYSEGIISFKAERKKEEKVE
jgi:hypothetical protein